MVRELYQRLREYFNNLPEPTEEERQFIRELNAGYFPITSVHRDDLEGQGFDVEKISDDDMQNLAEKMADDYCEQLFWPSMEIIAGEILSFPKVKTKDIICPKCNSENIRYDIHESRFHCGECSLAWDDKLYVLVEFPEDSAIPSIIMQAIGSVMTYGMNLILIQFTSTATAVFGVYFKVQSFVFMPVFGLNNGMVPIVAYNYGAGNRKRVKHVAKLSIIYAVSIMMVGLLVFQIFPDKLLAMFNASENMLTIGVPALRIISLSFMFAGFCIVIGSVFQALGNGVYSLAVSVARQLLVLLPAAYLLSLTGKVENVWWAFPIAELMSLAVTLFFYARINKKIISKIGENAADLV